MGGSPVPDKGQCKGGARATQKWKSRFGACLILPENRQFPNAVALNAVGRRMLMSITTGLITDFPNPGYRVDYRQPPRLLTFESYVCNQ